MSHYLKGIFFKKTEHYDKQNHQIMEYKKVQYNIEYEL